jgi:Asp/Glu/hydantoin racemase
MDQESQEQPEMGAHMVIRRGGLQATTNDIIAIGVLVLAVCSGLVALIVTFAWIYGKVPKDGAEYIILGCVGGGVLSGIVSALVGRQKASPHR